MTAVPMQNDRTRTMIDIQVGGPGFPWKVLDFDAEMNGPSGGHQGAESIWGTGVDGQAAYLGTRRSGDPERFTFQTMRPLTQYNFLKKLDCPFNIRWRYRCGDPRDVTEYTEAYTYIDTVVTSRGFDKNLRNSRTGDSEDINRQLDMSAGLEQAQVKLVHLDISGSQVDFAINKIISVGIPQCAGDCTPVELTGQEEFWAVTDRDSTPGYSGNPTAMFGYSYFDSTGARQWAWSYINVAQAADATDVKRVGNKIVVATSKGPAYAAIQDVKNGVAKPWTLGTGISSNYPTALAVTPNNTVWGVGPAGNVYKSVDGGFTWSTVDAGTITSVTLNSVAFFNDDQGVIGGNSGVLLEYQGGSLSLVTVTTAISGGTTLSSNINTVAIPPGRGKEVYLGTAAGTVWRSRSMNAQIPLFETKPFALSGEGNIDDIQFAGAFGQYMFVLQRNSSNNSRVLRDVSGGDLGDSAEIVGDFTSPSNFKINSIAPANPNFALTAGEVHQTYAFIGAVQGATAAA